MNLKERFEEKFDITEKGCWVWAAGVNRQGYGQFSYEGVSVGAHRVSWLIYKGPIQNGLFVLHKPECHNTSCVNPEHLYLGTHQENMKDRREAGTAAKLFGDNHHNCKLTDAQLQQLRHHLEFDGISHKTLGKMFGVSRSLIGLIANGKRRNQI